MRKMKKMKMDRQKYEKLMFILFPIDVEIFEKGVDDGRNWIHGAHHDEMLEFLSAESFDEYKKIGASFFIADIINKFRGIDLAMKDGEHFRLRETLSPFDRALFQQQAELYYSGFRWSVRYYVSKILLKNHSPSDEHNH
jgi:hypothetical protein